MSTAAVIANACLAGLVIVGYVVLTALGNDGTALLGVLGGQGLGAVVHMLTGRAGASG